jgi:hypothetical protein
MARPVTVAFIGNQGGRDVVAFYAGMARTLAEEFGIQSRFTVWLDSELQAPAELGAPQHEVSSFESFVRTHPPACEDAVDALVREYREVNWSEVVAAERAFTDYSMLLGASGERQEDREYVQGLVLAIVRHLEQVTAGCSAMICQTADTLFSLIAFKVARHLGIPAFAIAPAWLLEPGKGGGFFATSEFLECERMKSSYLERQARPLTAGERSRGEALKASILGFQGKTAFHDATSKGKSAGRRAVTPNISRLVPYLVRNARKNKQVEYIKIDPLRKLRANLLRLVRKRMTRNVVGPLTTDGIPPRCVFYALHYQPEQSTLAQGVWHVNQVALVENLSKALPLGYTLIVKEHPWGRGNRPRWQYQHMAALYNVSFCDAPAKEIVRRVDAVITVSGTVAMESLVLDKPTVMLGRNFFEFSDLLYRVRDIQDLPDLLARILIDGDYARQPDRNERLLRFLMAYLDGLVPYFPLPEHASEWARALAREPALMTAPTLTRTNRAI